VPDYESDRESNERIDYEHDCGSAYGANGCNASFHCPSSHINLDIVFTYSGLVKLRLHLKIIILTLINTILGRRSSHCLHLYIRLHHDPISVAILLSIVTGTSNNRILTPQRRIAQSSANYSSEDSVSACGSLWPVRYSRI
jgi:hypothetical protein